MDNAESLMESQPDSAFELLKSIDRSSLNSKSEKARYALLMSIALDKNYIDTTTFDVLQPAIDYYLKKGTPDEKLRTYYYQGRIYQNMGDRDNALNCYYKAVEEKSQITDLLTMARALVAQGYIFFECYDFQSYVDVFTKAADIYTTLSLESQKFDCILNALNGAIILGDKDYATDLVKLCEKLHSLNETETQSFQNVKLGYVVKFSSVDEIKEFVSANENNMSFDTNGILNLALAYNRIESLI